MVHWVLPNNLLTSMTAADWPNRTPTQTRTYTRARGRLICAQCQLPSSSTIEEYTFRSEVKELNQREGEKKINFALQWSSSARWRIVCMNDSVELQPRRRQLLIENASIGLWTVINCYG